MKITICGSMKFNQEMVGLGEELKKLGHEVFMPVAVDGVDYWSEDSKQKIEAKQGLNLIGKHMDKIEGTDAILVANYTKGEIKNYIGANSFLEMGFAFYRGKKIFVLNQLPDQKYINDEILSFNAVILDKDLTKIA